MRIAIFVFVLSAMIFGQNKKIQYHIQEDSCFSFALTQPFTNVEVQKALEYSLEDLETIDNPKAVIDTAIWKQDIGLIKNLLDRVKKYNETLLKLSGR